MTFGVTWENRSNNGSRLDMVIHDTSEEAREHAEKLIKSPNAANITVWQQVAVPKLETSISWEERL